METIKNILWGHNYWEFWEFQWKEKIWGKYVSKRTNELL
jgi:hypothetical protein